VTKFQFSDGSIAHAVQDHGKCGVPFKVKGVMSLSQKHAVANWTGCNVNQ
jgi:hypothetical protein